MKVTLRAARVNAGLTQTEVANKLEIALTTLLGYEKGRVDPPFKTLLEMCELYGCTIDDLKWN